MSMAASLRCCRTVSSGSAVFDPSAVERSMVNALRVDAFLVSICAILSMDLMIFLSFTDSAIFDCQSFFLTVIGFSTKMSKSSEQIEQVWDVGKDVPSSTTERGSIDYHEHAPETAAAQNAFAAQFLRDSNDRLQSQIAKSLSALSLHANGRSNGSMRSVYHVHDGIYMHVSLRYEEPALGNQVLKSDFFAGLHKLPDPPLLEGSFNFRRTRLGDCVIYGVSQPSKVGIKNVIHHLLDIHTAKRIVWVNLREEPIVFLKGQPVSTRERDTLNINLDYLINIEAFDLASIEERLCADISYIAKHNENKVEFYHQNDLKENELVQMEISDEQVETVSGVFQRLFNDGYNVNFFRVPITDECAPGEDDFDNFVDIFRDADEHTCFVFNCQMGRGRTTTGMVCACIFHTIKSFKFDSEPSDCCIIPKPSPEKSSTDFLNGNYKSIADLLSAFYCHNPRGAAELKSIVDEAVDACDDIQNIRTSIFQCKEQSESPLKCDELRPVAYWTKRALNYLERYFMIIVFAQYLKEQVPHRFSVKFSVWLKRHWGVKRLLRNMTLE